MDDLGAKETGENGSGASQCSQVHSRVIFSVSVEQLQRGVLSLICGAVFTTIYCVVLFALSVAGGFAEPWTFQDAVLVATIYAFFVRNTYPMT